MQGPPQAAQGADSRETDEELPEQNGASPEDVSGPEEGADEPEVLPESWEAMAGAAAGRESAHDFEGGVVPMEHTFSCINPGKRTLCKEQFVLSRHSRGLPV